MSERVVTSTPRHVGATEEEENLDFMGFEQTSEEYRDIEEEMSSIDMSFFERETVLLADESCKGEESGIIFNRMGRRKGKEKKAKRGKVKKRKTT